MKDRICLAIALMAAIAFGWLRSYEVLPTQADWSGWTNKSGANNWVGNTFTANFDSICWCDVFGDHVGDTGTLA
jgi:hypothetical protein